MTKRIFVAGHRGMVGSAIVRQLAKDPRNEIITANRDELDLVNQQSINDFFASQSIDQVYLAAAKVGGIHANNTYPAEFIYENLMIEANIIHAAHQNDVQDLLFLGSSCIYPKMALQPMKEDALLTGPLETTNEPYAIAKIAGIKLCESYNRQYGRNYRSVMPTNLYGENDNFHLVNSHVIPALIRRFHDAKISDAPSVTVWGSGEVRREFLYVNDMAEGVIYVMNLKDDIYRKQIMPKHSHINIGSGLDVTIKELALLIRYLVGFKGEILFDYDKPDGTPRKLLDVSLIEQLGWKATTSLNNGLSKTYEWFLLNQNNFRG